MFNSPVSNKTDISKKYTSYCLPTYWGQSWLSPGLIPPRTVWKHQPEIRRASSTRRIRSHPQIRVPYIHYPNKPRTKIVVSRADVALHGVENPTWGSWTQRRPGRIGFHPPIRNPSMHVQLQQTGDDNGGPPGRCRPARVETPTWGSRSQCRRGRIRSYRRIRNPSMHLQLQQTGNENTKMLVLRVDIAPRGVKNQTPLAGC